MLKTSDFNFYLPSELIANQPINPKDLARMLVWENEQIIDKKVIDLIDFVNKGDVIVFNDAKVIKAKLVGKRGEAKIEINLHKNLGNNVWKAFAKPAKRLKIGDKFIIADDFFALVLDKNENGIVDLQFNVSDLFFLEYLEKYGQMPLPPYIKNNNSKDDAKNYQTIYAKNSGAVAAPTAGLHFTKRLFETLEKKDVTKVFTTLNVGAGTFLPVKSHYIQDHQMHSEYFSIDQVTCDIINETKLRGGKIIAVGTTSLRVLESAIDKNGILKPATTETDIFIYPPYSFKVVDVLMTNFHLPKSTLFMLISAFVGQENAKKIYEHAIINQYRFYSFGDATLLFR
jgi:S-adenosylmethionine:tRNA ribosyltransferase-isomerase